MKQATTTTRNTAIKECTCVSEFQDAKYGKNKGVMNWSRVADVAYFLVNLFVAGCLGFAINFYITMRRQGIPCNDWLVGALMGLIAGMMLASWLWHTWYKGP